MLVLFDIDGILVESPRGKFDYWKASIKKHFGLDASSKDVYMEGRTDRAIMKELLELKGIKNPEHDERFSAALMDLGYILASEMKNLTIDKISGVEYLINRLLEEKQVIGLLTGNTPNKARAKLEGCGFWKYFKIGAFGHETMVRSELVPVAMKDAKDKTGIAFKKRDVFLIGDTVRDIRCAKEAGVKSIAVATGKESFEQLEKEKPDYLFKDFSDVEKIVAVICK
ncbi:MAG: HAD hydrolase-like protein [Candidatus Aenigmarchaeota archaeon]|nr:HAD hydrolase-like protein [Candidatus Aenigmarchaeota archaeon]